MIRRVYLRVEGWYYLFVIVFVIGGAVLRNVNILVALAGLMAAALILHWQLVLRSLSGIDVIRSLPARRCAGDPLDVEVTVVNRGSRHGSAWALEFTDYLQRIDPPDDEEASEVKLLYPRIVAGQEMTRRYQCVLTRRGVYQFSKARIGSRYPLGLVEGSCFLDLPDRLVVYPEIGNLSRQWRTLIEAEHAGQQSTRHRRGWNEGDFYALREWRNGDSHNWIHWRTSAKLGRLAVRQFEQRRSCDVVLLLDLHQPTGASTDALATIEAAISFAATAVVDLCRHGGSSLGLIIASRETGGWYGSASPLFAQELLEHLSVCRASDAGHLTEATDSFGEMQHRGGKLLVISTRSRDDAAATLDRKTRDSLKWRRLEQAVWLNGMAGNFDAYFTLPGASSA